MTISKFVRTFLAFAALMMMAAVPPALAAIALVSNGVGLGNGFAVKPSVTVNSAGATLLTACVSGGTGNGTTKVVTDSKGNTWNRLTRYTDGSIQIELFYSMATSVGASHVIDYDGDYASMEVAAWSGTDTGSVLDGTVVGNGAGGTSIQPGSKTPSQTNSLLVTCLGVESFTGTIAINSSFSITNSAASGANNSGGSLGYLLQGAPAAVNPTWSGFSSSSAAATMAVFKAAGGGAALGHPVMMTTP